MLHHSLCEILLPHADVETFAHFLRTVSFLCISFTISFPTRNKKNRWWSLKGTFSKFFFTGNIIHICSIYRIKYWLFSASKYLQYLNLKCQQNHRFNGTLVAVTKFHIDNVIIVIFVTIIISNVLSWNFNYNINTFEMTSMLLKLLLRKLKLTFLNDVKNFKRIFLSWLLKVFHFLLPLLHIFVIKRKSMSSVLTYEDLCLKK